MPRSKRLSLPPIEDRSAEHVLEAQSPGQYPHLDRSDLNPAAPADTARKRSHLPEDLSSPPSLPSSSGKSASRRLPQSQAPPPIPLRSSRLYDGKPFPAHALKGNSSCPWSRR